MYNRDETNFINRASPTTGCATTSLMHNARCNKTKARIQKVNIM